MTDRTTPVFAAYGLAERMIALIKRKSDEECKSQLKELARDLDDKEKDALEVSIRKECAPASSGLLPMRPERPHSFNHRDH